MNRKEMIFSIKGTARRSDKRINSELDEMFGEGKNEFSMEDFENYLRHFVFHLEKFEKEIDEAIIRDLNRF